MTTFKNNARYAELVLCYLDVAYRKDTPLSVEEVLTVFQWRFKGGKLSDAASGTRLVPLTSKDEYPDGTTDQILAEWPNGPRALALRSLLQNRLEQGKLRSRGVLARLGTYQMMTANYGITPEGTKIYSGLRAVYLMFGMIWEWAKSPDRRPQWSVLESFTQELLMGSASASMQHLPTVEANREDYWAMLSQTEVPGLLAAIFEVKDLIRLMGSGRARSLARLMGMEEKRRMGDRWLTGAIPEGKMSDPGDQCYAIAHTVGPLRLRVLQECALLGSGPARLGLGKSDAERLHQLLMSVASALVGVCAQAAVGTELQKSRSKMAVAVAQRNISRIVKSARLVAMGDEVLVCKGYRRAYTAHLGWLAGPLCRDEATELEREAEETAPRGVLDVQGFLQDARTLDAASSLNAAKMFKVCPAPDVSPGAAMMDRIKQIGDGNEVDPGMMPMFEEELRTQILRAHIRAHKGRIPLRAANMVPDWHASYLTGKLDEVPSAEIHTFLAWEGTAKMPDVSPYDPSHWKDSGLGADSIWEVERRVQPGVKANMITRLIFDDECPMPGRQLLSDDHVIKFFIKAEGHKDPARGIFSANLVDRQAQSWMERGVESVARQHPSFMIGQPVDVRDAKVTELTRLPERAGWVPLYYSFDISGWSAKMPAETQRISHNLWANLFGGHLFKRASELNENAFIYLSLDGYTGWFRNTHANLEGFNGKEMTMVLVALLSLSVRVWRERVVEEGVLPQEVAMATSALLFAYIDDGLSRIDLPRQYAVRAFDCYKRTVIDTFARCGFSVEVSKCFPSDRFSIFLNEVYLGGRHVVHGVRAAMAIGSEPTERHTSLVERVTSVATGARGAVMAGLNPFGGTLLMAYHTFMHLWEWVKERDPVILAVWCLAPRSWGGLGLPNMLQLFVSGSGSAFDEGVATLQSFARANRAARKFYLAMCRTPLVDRTAMSVLTAPMSGRVNIGYMVDSRVATAVRKALTAALDEGKLSPYAIRLLRYADMESFLEYAEAVIPVGEREVLQEQMIDNVAEAHPHVIFSAFARRLEKSETVKRVVGRQLFEEIMAENRKEARRSIEACARAIAG